MSSMYGLTEVEDNRLRRKDSSDPFAPRFDICTVRDLDILVRESLEKMGYYLKKKLVDGICIYEKQIA